MTAAARAGTLLPALLAALAALALLAAGAAHAAVASHREAARGAAGALALMAAESALEHVTGQLRAALGDEGAGAGFRMPEPGEEVGYAPDLGPRTRTRVTVLRPHPYLLWIRAEGAPVAAPAAMGAPPARVVERGLWLVPPPFAVSAALASRGALELAPGAEVDGGDPVAPDSPCAPGRERVSVPPVAAHAGLAVDTATVRHQLEGRGRWRLPAIPAPSRPGAFGAVGVRLSDGVSGTSRWRGLLVVEGALRVRGTLEVEGVLLVLGPLVSEGALRVRGAVAVLPPAGAGAAVGPDTRIAYDRCAVQRALATVAQPRPGPVGAWGHAAP